MAAKSATKREHKNIGYELFIGALSVLSIYNLLLLYVFPTNADTQTVLYVMDALMTPIFFGDFFYRLKTAEHKRDYFLGHFGWADLLSSLPFPQLKLLRLFRLWRVIRLIREFGAANLVHEFVTHRAENALLTVVFLVVCVLEFSSIWILRAEANAPDANITDASDAIWWTYVTITTVGYGDRYPTTNAGRMIGILVMTAGVGLFGTLSGFLAQSFLSPAKPKPQVSPEANTPKAQLDAIMQLIEAQEQSTAALKSKVQEISKLV